MKSYCAIQGKQIPSKTDQEINTLRPAQKNRNESLLCIKQNNNQASAVISKRNLRFATHTGNDTKTSTNVRANKSLLLSSITKKNSQSGLGKTKNLVNKNIVYLNNFDNESVRLEPEKKVIGRSVNNNIIACRNSNKNSLIKRNINLKAEKASINTDSVNEKTPVKDAIELMLENLHAENYSSHIDLNLNTTKSTCPLVNSCTTCSTTTPNSQKESSSTTLTATDSSDTEQEFFSGIKLLKPSVKTGKPKPYPLGSETVTKNNSSLNEKSGSFYICHCMEHAQDSCRINPKRQSSVTDFIKKIKMENPITCTNAPISKFNNLCPSIQEGNYDKQTCSNVKCENNSKGHYCKTCGNNYNSTTEMYEHMQSHHFKCHMCNNVFLYENDYMSHMQSHLLKVFVCHFCRREFGQKTTLVQHLDAHFENEFYDNVLALEEEYKVAIYNRSLRENFNTNNSYYYYERPESLNKYSFECDYCHITFYDFNDYQMHWRTHYGQ